MKEFFEAELKAVRPRHRAHAPASRTCTRTTGLSSELAGNTFRDHLILEYEVPKFDGDLRSPNVFVELDEDVCKRKVDSHRRRLCEPGRPALVHGGRVLVAAAPARPRVGFAHGLRGGIPLPEARPVSSR